MLASGEPNAPVDIREIAFEGRVWCIAALVVEEACVGRIDEPSGDGLSVRVRAPLRRLLASPYDAIALGELLAHELLPVQPHLMV
jgi:hypothetical protein